MDVEMKLVFPNREHEQVTLDVGLVVVGSDPSSDIRIEHASVAARHAQIDLDQYGAKLKVFDAADITRINGELVAASRLLRSGDSLQFGDVQCVVINEAEKVVTDDRPEPVSVQDETRFRYAVPSFALRGVSGQSFGRVFALYGTTLVGRSPEADIRLKRDEISRQHAEIVLQDDGLTLKDLRSANGTFVNGRRVRKAVLKAGDEIRFDTERFIVQGAENQLSDDAIANDTAGYWKFLVVLAVLSLIGLLVVRVIWFE